MTDKEQIIIDGVDVSKCKYFEDGECGCEYYLRYGYEITMHDRCEECPNCYFKQLARKTQECEKIFAKTYQMWMYYIANGLNNASDVNIQYLLEDLGKVTKILAELCNIKDSTLSYYAGQAQDETNRYRKAVEEIEEVIQRNDWAVYHHLYKELLGIISKANPTKNKRGGK
ncbi:TPA: hypothetical protein CPT95_00050 [Candidatus Gastranaerophilales bacterium HUM_15]|jgi:hypothetical protein|nr:MAG TPA: hypothetical protein CPT95_00050 [Candidatus Gastranaerophilales bacterium HUM_15]